METRRERLLFWHPIHLFDDEVMDESEPVHNSEDDEYFDEKGPQIRVVGMPTPQKMIQTHFGTFQLDDRNNVLRGLPAFIAHINFPFTNVLRDKLDDIEGIEIFKQVGRYRIAFVFGAMFDTEEIMWDIETALDVDLPEDIMSMEDLNDDMQHVIEGIKNDCTSEHWIVYVFPNGKYIFENLDSDKELKARLQHYQLLGEMSHGCILNSAIEKNNELRDDNK